MADPVTSSFYPESVVCAFVFAADHGVEITNNSYYVDPWLYNCPGDPDQRAIVDAVNRAAQYSHRKGVLNVASAGNSDHDLASHEIVDATSPTTAPRSPGPSTRTSAGTIPTQLPGVVTVSATGVQKLKSYYSSYGLGVVDVAGPGGDRYQIPATPSANGRILSTLPGNTYGYLQGTSMASPHVAAPSPRSSRAATRTPPRSSCRGCSRPRPTTQAARRDSTTRTATACRTPPAPPAGT